VEDSPLPCGPGCSDKLEEVCAMSQLKVASWRKERSSAISVVAQKGLQDILREEDVLYDLQDARAATRGKQRAWSVFCSGRRYPLIGVAVAMAQFFAAAGNLVAQRPMLTEPEKESAGIPGFYEYELSLGLGKSTVLLYHVLHNDDALGHAIQAAWIGSKVPSPATSIVLILGPRVDLLKDCIFTASVLQLAARAEDEGTRQRGFWIGVCSLVTLFTPGPFLFCDRASRMEVAKEFLAGAGAEFIKIAIMAASHGLEVRSEEGQGPTPLMCPATALLGDTEILATLLTSEASPAGAKKDVQGRDGETALDVAEGEFLPVAPRERPAAPRGPRGSQDQVRK
ncbi:unnamed protein product, partial [Symbiodinium microadriaticum]